MTDEALADDRTLWRQIHNPDAGLVWEVLFIVWMTIGLPILVGAFVAHVLRSRPRWLRMFGGWTSGILTLGLLVLLTFTVLG